VERARLLLRAGDRLVDDDATRLRKSADPDARSQFIELTGPGFVASLALAAGIASAAGLQAFQSDDQTQRIAPAIAAASILAACIHAQAAWRGLPVAKTDARWLISRHRAILALLGICAALTSLLDNSESDVASVAFACALLLLCAAGAASAAADHPSLLIWVAAVLALPATLALASGDRPAPMAWTLVTGSVVVLGLAERIRTLVARARRVRLENDQLVAQLRQQVVLVEAANQEKTRFLGAASHDLRQPMHALGLFAAALEKDLRGGAYHHRVLSMARAVDALENSFGAMLDVSKLDAGIVQPEIQSFSVRDLFRRLHMQCAGQAEEKGLSLRLKAGGKLVTSDPQLLERVLSNLIHNAIRYTRDGGVAVVARTRGDRTSLEVWDSGVGIEAEELPKIFNEFYQVGNQGRDRAMGLGMGLSIVKRLILLLGYELEVVSVAGRGTVFKVVMPSTQLAELPTVVLGAETLPSPPEDGRVVLVIDDEASVREGMKELLSGWGYTVLLAGSIDEATFAVRSNGLIDVVVSDLRLSESEDGLQAIEEVRLAYGAPLPAILVTGDTSPAEVKRAHDGGHPVLFKPVRARDLFAALRHTP
jgi:signal transduction histidine kinase/CheY-like chemotaxis protein